MKNKAKAVPQTKSKKKSVKTQASGSTKATSSLIDQGFLSQGLMVSKDKKSHHHRSRSRHHHSTKKKSKESKHRSKDSEKSKKEIKK